jgi:hypothetical protein
MVVDCIAGYGLYCWIRLFAPRFGKPETKSLGISDRYGGPS